MLSVPNPANPTALGEGTLHFRNELCLVDKVFFDFRAKSFRWVGRAKCLTIRI